MGYVFCCFEENPDFRKRFNNLDSIGFLLLIQILLIILNAIFACAEMAIISMNDTKLEKLAEQGNKRAKRLKKLTENPSNFLSTIQVAITLAGFLGSAFAAENFSDRLVNALIGLGLNVNPSTLNTICVILITIILSYFTLVFGELVPKRLGMKKAESIALALSGIVSAIASLFRPVVWFLTVSTNAILRLLGIDPNEEDEEVSEEEIRMMVDAGSEKGTIDEDEKEFIQNVFEFDDLTAEEIVTHRTDVSFLWLEDSCEEWEKIIHETRYNRYPVCQDSADNIVGVLDAKDYFRVKDKSRENVMAEAVKPAYFVPETIKADVLFRNMKKSGNTMAVVLDEYGGMVGIVTLNDLVEELVGELNEDDSVEDGELPAIELIAENTWRIRGNVELSEIEEQTGIDFPDEDFETFTGLVFDSLGMIPEDGEQDISIEVYGAQIHVLHIAEHQIELAEVKQLPKAEDEETEE